MKEIKEEVENMRKEVKEIEREEKSWAMNVLEDYKKTNKRMFIIWIITFIALILVTGYCIYLLNDREVTEAYVQDIDDVEVVDNSNISNGGK